MAKRKTTGELEDRLREYRFRRNWTQEMLAGFAGVSRSTIKRAEAGVPLAERTRYRLEQMLKKEAA